MQDPALRVSYLIQHCTGEAKKSIQDCVLLDPEEACDEAMSILIKRFGSNHLIARSYIEDLTQGPKIGANDVEALVRFTTDLRNAKIVLTQLEFTSDMNSSKWARNGLRKRRTFWSAVASQDSDCCHHFTLYNLCNNEVVSYFWNESDGDLTANSFASCIRDCLAEWF